MSVRKIEARFVSLGSSRGQILFKKKKKKVNLTLQDLCLILICPAILKKLQSLDFLFPDSKNERNNKQLPNLTPFWHD